MRRWWGKGVKSGSVVGPPGILSGLAHLEIVLALRQRSNVSHKLEPVLRIALKVRVRHARRHA